MTVSRYHDGSIATSQLPLSAPGSLPPGTIVGPIRAVVLATHVTVDDLNRTSYVECDLLPYVGPGRILSRVPVAAGGGIYQGTVWTPNPSSRTPDDVTDPSELDGDHVMVSFLGGRASDPVITDRLPHPRATYRPVEPATLSGSARHPATASAPCVYMRHQGTVTMVDRRGNVVVDTMAAPQTAAGEVEGGTEPAGNTYVQLRSAGKLEVRVGNTVLFVVENGQVKIGANPSMHPALFEALRTWLTNSLSVSTAFGPSGGAITPLSDSCKSPGVLIDAP